MNQFRKSDLFAPQGISDIGRRACCQIHVDNAKKRDFKKTGDP
jgi:hypothetical protein